MNYTFSTPEATYLLSANPDNPDNVFIHAHRKEDLETVLDSLELAGVQDGRYFEDLEIEEEDQPDPEYYPYFIEVTRVDLVLFMQFEVLNYLGVNLD
jgi:hypothetical protein